MPVSMESSIALRKADSARSASSACWRRASWRRSWVTLHTMMTASSRIEAPSRIGTQRVSDL